MNEYDVIIIGAGVVGCAVAMQLSKYDLKICVIDKEEDVCSGTSKANSAIAHAGFDALPGTIKAKMNVRGAELIRQLSKTLDFSYIENGSLVLCFDEADMPKLNELYDRGIKNGVLMLSGFYENGEFYVYDTGFRLQGEAPHLLMKAIHGFDQREMLIRFALTGSEGDVDLEADDDARLKGKWAATLWFLLKKGKIAKIEGFEHIGSDSRIVANIQRLHEGDTVPDEWVGNEKQVLTRLYIVCGSKRELAECLKEYQSKVKVTDENGSDMLLNGFDVDRALATGESNEFKT